MNRREFLTGIGKVAAIASLPPIVTLPVKDFPTEPAFAGLWDGGREAVGLGYKRLPLASVHQIKHKGRWYWDAADMTWESVTFLADEIRLFGVDDRELARIPMPRFTGNGGDLVVVWSPEGLAQGVA